MMMESEPFIIRQVNQSEQAPSSEPQDRGTSLRTRTDLMNGRLCPECTVSGICERTAVQFLSYRETRKA
jgi:hypothetical protein